MALYTGLMFPICECLREEILMTALFFCDLEMWLFTLSFIKGSLGITCATDLFTCSFLSSALYIAELQFGLLSSTPLLAYDHVLDTIHALALPASRSAYAQLVAWTSTSSAPQLQPMLYTGLTSSGARLHGTGCTVRGRD